ncbi:MAG: hypothetical protein ABIO75_06005, partial [Thermomonas sp.]
MNLRPFPNALISALMISLLAACASIPAPQVRHAQRLPGTQAGAIQRERLPEAMGNAGPQPVIRRG